MKYFQKKFLHGLLYRRSLEALVVFTFANLIVGCAQSRLATDAASPQLAPGTYTAVTESEWTLELKLERDGTAVYTIGNWEVGKAATTTSKSSVKARWSREGSSLTVSFAGDASAKVVYALTGCLSYESFGLKGCSFGLKPITNTASRGYSQDLWNVTTFKVPNAA